MPNTERLSARVARLTDATCGGYSFDRYASWPQVIRLLCKQGWTDEQIEAAMLSKWTRWAADEEGKPYGRATAKGVLPILLRYATGAGSGGTLDQLTREHLGNQ